MTPIKVLYVVALLSVFVGCDNNNAVVYPVTGKVTFKGKPMPLGGSIAFIPSEGQYGPAAGGTIDEEGHFVLSTYDEGDGAVAGKHRVVISQVTELEPGMDEVGQDGEKRTKQAKPKPTAVPKEEWIPAVYGDHRKSPLSATVNKEDNTITLDLTTE